MSAKETMQTVVWASSLFRKRTKFLCVLFKNWLNNRKLNSVILMLFEFFYKTNQMTYYIGCDSGGLGSNESQSWRSDPYLPRMWGQLRISCNDISLASV